MSGFQPSGTPSGMPPFCEAVRMCMTDFPGELDTQNEFFVSVPILSQITDAPKRGGLSAILVLPMVTTFDEESRPMSLVENFLSTDIFEEPSRSYPRLSVEPKNDDRDQSERRFLMSTMWNQLPSTPSTF